MGALIWHEWARYVALTASCYTIWASYWGIFYRKFFWDFVTGTLRAPGGMQPSASIGFFITIIVRIPLVQIMSALLALFIILLEYPAPFLKNLSIHRSLPLRVVLLSMLSFLTILFYQGTNGCIWSLVAVFGYTRAILKGETMEVAKSNRGTAGGKV